MIAVSALAHLRRLGKQVVTVTSHLRCASNARRRRRR
jgi:hypothetical protein